MDIDPLWIVEPFEDAGVGNTPPLVRFEQGSKSIYTGPPHGIGPTYSVKSGDPLPLTVWVTDDGKVPSEAQQRRREGAPATIFWSKFRGPGAVPFDDPRPKLGPEDGKASTTAKFTDPGEYILRLQANDASGDGGGGLSAAGRMFT